MTDANYESLVKAAELQLLELLGKELYFPEGLLGFPNCQRYKIARFDPGDGSESPFFILESTEHNLSFTLIHPDFVAPDYELPVSPELLISLLAHSEKDLVPMLIVTVRDRVEDITVNLQGPLIINSVSSMAMQLVIEDYPVRHPLLQTTAQ
ncbi:MAG TPA: flagellar assembly protein FliW [Candidatus Binatia bacterium]|jgi:flagellar assembly factor FliW